jgi:RNA-binding protein
VAAIEGEGVGFGMEELTNPQIRKLKGLAQRMEATLKVGKQGLSDAFLKSLDEALTQHELVKVRLTEHKEQRKELAPLLAQRSSAHLVTLLGNVVVLFRRNADPGQWKVQF